ncbi:MAG: hypothetical protein FH758_13235 [Firmicutes bacterium]|nr:hypothetical protein [Bacillota bacterium]
MGKRKRLKKRKKNRNNANLKRQNNEKISNDIKLVANDNYTMDTNCISKKVFRHYSRSVPFVPKSCIVPVNLVQPNIKKSTNKASPAKQKDLTPHIYAPNFQVKRESKKRNASASFVPPSCIINISDKSPVTKPPKNLQPIIPKPPKIITTSVIIGPKSYLSRKKKHGSKKEFVSKGCIIVTMPMVSKQRDAKSTRLLEYNRKIPDIIGSNKPVRRKRTFGNSAVIVSASCIIKPHPIKETSSYDWRKAFPKPVNIDKTAEIVGPDIKFRHKKSVISSISFVPQSCIINNSISTGGTSKETTERIKSVDALAQLPPEEIESSGNNWFLAVAAVIIIIALAFYFVN